MFATRLLLVAISAVLMMHVNAQKRCTNAKIGQQSSITQNPPEQNLSPGQADWDISITSTCQTVGVEMQVCDTDVEPTVTLQSMNDAWVHRNGKLLGVATVDTVIYCSDSRRWVHPRG